MKIFAVCAGLLAAFFIVACGNDTGTRFDYHLQGTWISNESDAIYSGALEITSDRITITGYGENQTPPRGDDNNRPFKGFTKGTALKGYSEEGKFFIEDIGMLQEGIPYTYWETDKKSDYRKQKFLSFTFGSRIETLKNSENIPENAD